MFISMWIFGGIVILFFWFIAYIESIKEEKNKERHREIIDKLTKIVVKR